MESYLNRIVGYQILDICVYCTAETSETDKPPLPLMRKDGNK